jgi:glycerol-3-phosphate acyltransferase PlsY
LDIREHGSGNAGASNVTTIMGVKYGVYVGFIDILKGIIAVLIVKWLYPASPDLAFLSGLMSIIGHMFPFFMRFRGGKGVATLIGMMFGVNWKLGVLFILLVIVPAFITDYIVAGSLSAFVALPVVSFLREYSIPILVFSFCMMVLSFYLHRSNIHRIQAGEELKIRAVLFKKK